MEGKWYDTHLIYCLHIMFESVPLYKYEMVLFTSKYLRPTMTQNRRVNINVDESTPTINIYK